MNLRTILLVGIASGSMTLVSPGQEPVDAAAQRGPLAGPVIDDAAVPGVSMQFAENPLAPARRGYDGLVLPVYVDALRTIDLTDQQRDAAIEIIRQAKEEREAFEAEHAEEIRALRAEARKLRQPTDEAVTDRRPMDEPVTDRRPEPPVEGAEGIADVRSRFHALRQQMPPEEPYVIELWNLLTPEQQTEVEAFLEQRQEEQRQQRMERAGVSPEMMPQTVDQMQPGQRGDRTDSMSEENQRLLQRAGQMTGPRGRRADDLRQWMEGNQPPPPLTADDIVFEEDLDQSP